MADQITVRDLTTQLEHGDGHNARAFFSGKFEEERFKDLDAIKKLNEQDKAAGKTSVALDCSKSIYYADAIDITSTNGLWQDLVGGKRLYSDSLDLHTLTHSDATDKVPALRQQVDVRKLTDEMEAGDGKALAAVLAGRYQEERIDILDQVDALNQADLTDHRSDGTLDISVAGSKYGAATMGVVRERAGLHDSLFGGVQIYSETLNLETGKRTVSASIDERK